jgi:large subunit ribosomal protein L18
MSSLSKQQLRIRRHKRIRALIKGTSKRPRVSVFKSNRHIFIQVIDDESGKTLLSSKVVSGSKGKSKGTKSEKATEIGKMIAEKAKAAGINEIVFDRGGYKYHGRVKALADALRTGGLKF